MDLAGAVGDREHRLLQIVDSHTAGEPTRTIIDGLPDLGTGTLVARQNRLRAQHDWVRTSLIDEPRGSDVMVGAALVAPAAADCVAGVIFFNNVGYLGMCGHGTIGVVATLAWLGRIGPGVHRLETSVGIVTTTLHDDGRVSVENVPSYRYRSGVAVTLEDGRRLHGDIAWGGNWFFLCGDHGEAIALERTVELTRLARSIRHALEMQGITGREGATIDHVELTAPLGTAGQGGSPSKGVRNFVLCPGFAYDRSPCGTGTSAKVACLAADGQLAVGERYRVQGISGDAFEATYRFASAVDPAGIGESAAEHAPRVVPTITGRAYVTARLEVLFDPTDPFRFGLHSSGRQLL